MASGSRQVLEFLLGGERYCIDIAHVDEIVDAGEISRVPDTPPHVRGVMELRGATARIVDPKRLLDVEDDGEGGDYVVVLDDGDGEAADGDGDAGDGPTGWLVDGVERVADVDDDEVDREDAEGPVDGVVRRDDGFVVWVAPDAVESAA